MNKTSKDLRKVKRKTVNVSIEFKGAKKLIPALTGNLSLGGMFVATKEPLPVSKRTFFSLRSKVKPFNFNLEGEVVWNNGRGCKHNRKDIPSGMGIKFLDSRFLNKNAISTFINFINESDFKLCV